MNATTIRIVTGSAIMPYRDALAALRIAVFREWPYLYEGTLEYERNYLKDYAACPQSVVVIAMDGERVVGASTGTPMTAADADFQKAFAGTDYSIESLYYFGESVLLPEYRGRGTGRKFFAAREAQARYCHAAYAAFCAVDRSDQDPRRPINYHPLNPFWQKLGYVKQPKLQARFDWKEIGQSGSTTQTLTFWLKAL